MRSLLAGAARCLRCGTLVDHDAAVSLSACTIRGSAAFHQTIPVPELPEVEIAMRRLRDALVGQTVTAVHRLHPATHRALSDDDVAQVVGRRVERVERRGKHQLIHLEGGGVLHAHFRMNGDWEIGRAGEPLPTYTRAALELADGRVVALTDSRALATLTLHADGHGLELGPEATDPSLDAATLRARLAPRHGPIKSVLLDQRVIAGLGNIYAAEALWRAGIDPRVPANTLGAVRLTRLVDAIRATLADALDDPGRYADGEAQDRMQVYGREGEPCARCAAPIRRIVQGGRSTYFCAACQRR